MAVISVDNTSLICSVLNATGEFTQRGNLWICEQCEQYSELKGLKSLQKIHTWYKTFRRDVSGNAFSQSKRLEIHI